MGDVRSSFGESLTEASFWDYFSVMNKLIQIACLPTLLALRKGLSDALFVETRDGGDSLVINQLDEWIHTIDVEVERIRADRG